MRTCKCVFLFMGVEIIIIMRDNGFKHHSEDQIDIACEALAKKMGWDYVYREEDDT